MICFGEALFGKSVICTCMQINRMHSFEVWPWIHAQLMGFCGCADCLADQKGKSVPEVESW